MAASSLQDIKRRMKSVNSTEHITNAMKLVSAAKFRKAKAEFDSASDHLFYITESINDAFSSAGDIPEKYYAGNDTGKKTCYIAVTSCRGLCGSFNMNIINLIEEDIRKNGVDSEILVIGTKGRDYFMKSRHDVCGEYLDAPEEITFENCRELIIPLVSRYEAGEIDRIAVAYTSFKNTLEQEAKLINLLPFDKDFHKKKRSAVEDGTPEIPGPAVAAQNTGEPEVYDPKDEEKRKFKSQSMEFEPGVEAICSYLVPKYAEISLYGCVIESATCEHAARRIAMENATDNAREMLGELSLFYNRARQAAITSEITEIVAGSEAQA